MKEIILTDGSRCMVDDEDHSFLSRWEWRPLKCKNTTYAKRTRWNSDAQKSEHVLMHRVVADAPTGLEVDHADRNGLNNTKDNLRICCRSDNNANKKPWDKKKSSAYKGVHLHKRPGGHRYWTAAICKNYKQMHLGTFETEESAARAYDKAALKHHGEFARLNFPQPELGAVPCSTT